MKYKLFQEINLKVQLNCWRSIQKQNNHVKRQNSFWLDNLNFFYLSIIFDNVKIWTWKWDLRKSSDSTLFLIPVEIKVTNHKKCLTKNEKILLFKVMLSSIQHFFYSTAVEATFSNQFLPYFYWLHKQWVLFTGLLAKGPNLSYHNKRLITLAV